MMQSEQINELATALAKAQGQMGNARFNRVNPHYKSKYADLASIIDAVRGPLSANGLGWTQTMQMSDGAMLLITTLMHSSGQWIRSEYPLPVGGRPQEMGSAQTYAKRYSLSAITGIAADEDDDAESANGQPASTPKASIIKPAKPEPPMHPETGEVSPHTITAADELKWGKAFVDAVNLARDDAEIDQWLSDNNIGLETLKTAAPKIHDRVMARVAAKRQSLKKAA